VRHHLDAADAAPGQEDTPRPILSLIEPRIVLLVVPKTSTTVWILILLFGTPTATTTLLTTLATFLTAFLLTTLASLTSLLAALILTLILRHHYLPIGISEHPTAQVFNTFYFLPHPRDKTVAL
jgi:hypothetical protein